MFTLIFILNNNLLTNRPGEVAPQCLTVQYHVHAKILRANKFLSNFPTDQGKSCLTVQYHIHTKILRANKHLSNLPTDQGKSRHHDALPCNMRCFSLATYTHFKTSQRVLPVRRYLYTCMQYALLLVSKLYAFQN
jgi:hypothetical protein